MYVATLRASHVTEQTAWSEEEDGIGSWPPGHDMVVKARPRGLVGAEKLVTF